MFADDLVRVQLVKFNVTRLWCFLNEYEDLVDVNRFSRQYRSQDGQLRW